ncbi:MAG: hypothetical protein GWP16_03070 [Nitrospirae bacterium]|nr:hypothetical protein [Nitrospirota bacterium]
MKGQQGQYFEPILVWGPPFRTSQRGRGGRCYAAIRQFVNKEKAVAIPDYLICLNCEAACYVFEWKDDEVTEAYCELCTSEEIDQFLTQEDFDALIEA